MGMLMLTASKGESIVIGDDIKLVVREVSGKKVLLGFEAPKDVVIDRMKVHLRKIKERSFMNSDKLTEEIAKELKKKELAGAPQ